MATNFQDYVDHLFKTAPDRFEKVRENPVTGGRFMRGLDPIAVQKRLAIQALLAKQWFDRHKPPDAPDFPIRQDDREDLRWTNPLSYLVGSFARSLAHRDYQIKGHPAFDQFARGAMAHAATPEWIRSEEMQKRFPPTPLEGLGNGLLWRPPKAGTRRCA
jgi:hypothetical protein